MDCYLDWGNKVCVEAVTFGPRGGNRSSFGYFRRIREREREREHGSVGKSAWNAIWNDGDRFVRRISDNYVGEIVECFNTNLRSIESFRNKDGSVGRKRLLLESS